MKYILCVLLTGLLISCSSKTQENRELSAKIDSLAQEVKQLESAEPGLGEFMTTIQLHHAKLWFAGKNSNWKLAEFELDEIKETLAMAEAVEKNQSKIRNINMIYAPLDRLDGSITDKNEKAFEHNFQYLTNTCNECHQRNNFPFNVIKIPETPPVTNQEFAVKK